MQLKSREIQIKAFLDKLSNTEVLWDWIWLVETEALLEVYTVGPLKTGHPQNSSNNLSNKVIMKKYREKK